MKEWGIFKIRQSENSAEKKAYALHSGKKTEQMLSHATKHVTLDMSHVSLNESKIENQKEGDEMSFF